MPEIVGSLTVLAGVAGLGLLVYFVIQFYHGGVVADEMATSGNITTGEVVTGLLGLGLIGVSVAGFTLTKVLRRRRSDRHPQ